MPRAQIKFRLGFATAILGFLAVAASTAPQQLRQPGRSIPTVRLERGALETRVDTRGELRAARSAMLVAPPVGGSLQIIHLAKTGTRVKAGDLVVEFDPSQQEYNLEQNRSELLQAEEEITKAKADSAVQAAKDQVDLLKAKYDVRRAELEVSKNELVSAIDAKKNLLALEEAKRRLEQLEQDIRSRAASNTATLAVAQVKRNKARLAMQEAQHHIEEMRLRAPLGGLVAVKPNEAAAGGFFFFGMVLPDYREGDTVFPGSFVAEVLDTERMEIQTKVNESDRANVNPGQPVEIHIDALPGQIYAGRVKTVAGAAASNFWGGETARKFDGTIQFDKPDASLRPGLTAEVIIVGEESKNVLRLPRQAVFEKNGKPVVYTRRGTVFEAHEVKIARQTESQVAIEGLSEGTEVALVNPEERTGKTQKAASPLAPAAGGGRP